MSLKRKLTIAALSALLFTHQANATDLLDVYKQALVSDPIYQQAINQQLSTSEGVPITIAQLLPNISLSFDPTITKQAFSGANVRHTAVSPRNNTQKSYILALNLSQTIFNFPQVEQVQGALATSKSACATLYAALQDLMVRTSAAYFAVLQDEETLTYADAAKIAYKEQLDQAKQYLDVGLKTKTDVYTAKAAYDSAVATYIAAQSQLANDRENLRVITGHYYKHMSALRNDFPLVKPKPANMDAWVRKAQAQNWNIKSNQYAVEAAIANVRQQYGGHMPTVTLQGTINRQFQRNLNGYPGTTDQRKGGNTETDRGITLDMTLPVFSGGGVVAATNQAVYNLKVAQQQLEQTFRSTISSTRQSYMNIIANSAQLIADEQAIKSNISSLEGLEAGYRVGTQTMVDVLNQQQKLFDSQTSYAQDRYAFVNNIIALKQAAGTLSFGDLGAINAWLTDKPTFKKPRRLRKLSLKKLKKMKQKKLHKKAALKKKHRKKVLAKTKKKSVA